MVRAHDYLGLQDESINDLHWNIGIGCARQEIVTIFIMILIEDGKDGIDLLTDAALLFQELHAIRISGRAQDYI